MAVSPEQLGAHIVAEARALGFQRVGLSPVAPAARHTIYRDWLEAGRHGEMAYLATPEHELAWTPGTPAPGRGPLPAACWPDAPRADGPDDAWQDTLVRAAALENDGERASASLAWEAGMAAFKASGVRADRVFALPSRQLVPTPLVRQAIAAGDVERVDVVLGRVAQAFPFLREGADVYPAIAAWMRAQGAAERAAVWDARGTAAAGAFVSDGRRAAAAFDRVLPFALGAYLALPLAGFVLGLGLAARRRSGGGGGPPGPTVLAGFGVGILVLIAVILCGSLTGQLDVVDKHRSLPAELLQDGMAAPAVKTWVQTRVRDTARGPLLANIDAEVAAMARGGRAEVPPPSDHDMRLALAPRVGFMDRAMSGAHSLRLTAYLDPDRAVARVLAPVATLERAVILMVVAIALGLVLGRTVPRAWRVVHAVVPGASRWLGPVAGVVTMLTMASLVALAAGRGAGLGRPDPRPLFGVEALPLPGTVVGGVPAWVLPVLVAAIGVHILGIWMDRRFRRVAGARGVDNPVAAG